MSRFFRLSGFWILLLVWLPAGLAQTPSKIVKIEIKPVGPPAASDDLIRANIRTKVGDPYGRSTVDEDVRNLYGTGLFYNIQVVEKNVEGGIALTYLVQGKPRLTAIRFEGNKIFNDAKLRKKLTSKIGQPLDELKLFTDEQEIRKMYEKKGYPRTEVKYLPPTIDEAAGTGTATFEIKETPKVKITEVHFIGAQAFTQKKLLKVVKTRPRWMFSWLTGRGKLKKDELEDDRDRLAEFYRGHGYIDFEVKDVKVEQPTPKTMVVRFVIFEGKPYKVGAIHITGNPLFSTNQLLSLLRMNVGDTFTPSGLSSNQMALENYYGARGYIDVNAGTRNLQVVKRPNVESGTMDLDYNLEAGQVSYIEKIEIGGNTKTKDKVIRRELAVTPGETFDMVRVRLSRSRLELMQYFEKIDMHPEPTDVPNRKNLVVNVEEKNTGNLSLGAGFSSVDSVVGFVEMSQGNFDLFNPPTFTGGGQKLRLRVQLGTERQDYLLSFIEPWFLGRKLALGFDLYHRELDFQSEADLYDEVRTGARVSLTKALGSDYLIGSLNYTLEQVGIVNVSVQAPSDISDEAGYSLLSKFGGSIAYDTRKYDQQYSGMLPFGGQRTELEASATGGPLGGDQEFYKLDLRTAWYVKGPFRGHVLEVVGRSGVADAFGGSDSVPFYERWYLGGLYSLRGYQYRDISPKQQLIGSTALEPVGGDTYWFGSAEYSVPIVDRVRFALFYDIGNVMSGAYTFNFSDYADNWGIGLRLNLPIGPLRLDYAIPMSHPDDVGGDGRFQFGVGYSRDF